LKTYRDGAEQPFEEDDVALLAQVGSSLGAALRRGLARDARPSAAPPSAPGVIVLDAQLRTRARASVAGAWIDVLPAARIYAALGMLPAMIYRWPRSPERRDGARALERAVDGRWVAIEAAVLDGEDEGAVVVTLRAATPRESFDRLCRVFALSHRERELVAALLAGLDTRAVAGRLSISRHTVQDHLKSVFAKVGIHSRRELLATFGTSVNGD